MRKLTIIEHISLDGVIQHSADARNDRKAVAPPAPDTDGAD